MKYIISVLVIWISVVFVSPVNALGIQVPSSPRSDEVVRRVKPKLADELVWMGAQWGVPVYIRIFKKEKKLEIWLEHMDDQFVLFKQYRICTFGPEGLGPKLKEGDMRAPEGFYRVEASNMNPNSNFHLSFNIGYPNIHDRARGWTGGSIMVHGRCKSWGCFSLLDKDIEEVYALVEAALKHGQKIIHVHIFPFRMTTENIRQYQDHPWEAFWSNLKTGYDMFEKEGYRVPEVVVEGKNYVFRKSVIDGGYDFDPDSVSERGMHIIAEARFEPDQKDYFRQYFDAAVLKILDPHLEVFQLVIEPVFQYYSLYHVVIRDQKGRIVEVVPDGKKRWHPLQSAPDGLKRLISQIVVHHYQEEKSIESN